MNLNSVYGRLYSLTWCVFYMLPVRTAFKPWIGGMIIRFLPFNVCLIILRYRRVQTFGRDTIRRFSNNASSMKKLAARDFEDLLQVDIIPQLKQDIQLLNGFKCSLPVFEGLLPAKYDRMVQDLLFIFCTWHAYAKLRLHTASTLTGLKASTISLGQSLRDFAKKLCPNYDTRELPREEAARVRRKVNAANKAPAKKAKAAGKQPTNGKVKKSFNLSTYKLHALGDYVTAIWQFGPSSGYSTQMVRFYLSFLWNTSPMSL